MGVGINANLGRKSERSYFSNTVQKMSIKSSNYKNTQQSKYRFAR